VQLELASALDAGRAVHLVSQIHGAGDISVDGTVLTFSAVDASRHLARAVSDLAHSGIEVVDATTSEPTLDDVFVSLATGST
jgi:ABC-2 type transport system ATP-binding protein